MAETGWSKEFPLVSGWYWMRGFRQYRVLPVEINGNSFGMMYGNGVLFCAQDAEGAEFLGPISPSDFEQLIRLRKAAEMAVKWLDWIATDPETSVVAPGFTSQEAAAALREALVPKGEQS